MKYIKYLLEYNSSDIVFEVSKTEFFNKYRLSGNSVSFTEDEISKLEHFFFSKNIHPIPAIQHYNSSDKWGDKSNYSFNNLVEYHDTSEDISCFDSNPFDDDVDPEMVKEIKPFSCLSIYNVKNLENQKSKVRSINCIKIFDDYIYTIVYRRSLDDIYYIIDINQGIDGLVSIIEECIIDKKFIMPF